MITATIRGKQVTVPDEERQPCDVYSRVMGYFQPTHQWNTGKQSEWRDRVMYKMP